MENDPSRTRSVVPPDHDTIDALLRAAFGQANEADLVRQLRDDGDMWLELVKIWNGRIAAYAGLSRMQAPEGWACLAPVAVWPEYQNGACTPEGGDPHVYALGTRLSGEIATVVGAERKPINFPNYIVVLGEPGFYSRAGYDLNRAQKLTTPYPLDHTLLAGPGDDVPEVELIYPKAFGAE